MKKRVILLNRKIVVTGIIKYKDEFLVVKRSKKEDNFCGAWEFPGGKLEDGELLIDGLKRELFEEIGLDIKDRKIKIINYYDDIRDKIHYIELDFLIEVDNKELDIKLSDEHDDYCWIKKDTSLIDDFIKRKIEII